MEPKWQGDHMCALALVVDVAPPLALALVLAVALTVALALPFTS